MSYHCRICGKDFDRIPDDATRFGVGRRGHWTLYQFADGEVHDLRRGSHRIGNPKLTLHTRWHVKRGISKPDSCEFCSNPPQTDLLQEVVGVLTELPQVDPVPQAPMTVPELVQVTQEPEVEESLNTMQAAFRRFKS